MKPNQQKTMVVDRRLQRGLAKKIITYWCVTWLLVFTLPIAVRMFNGQLPFDDLAREIIADFWFPIAISVFLVPIIVWDSIRFSNRVTGPVHRINGMIRQMAANRPVQTISLRHDDFFQDLAENFNQLIDNSADESESVVQENRMPTGSSR